jgi:hypothetical protein
MKHRSRTQGFEYDTAAAPKVARFALFAAVTVMSFGCARAPAPTIEHGSDWRAAVHRFVETHQKHPAWGLSHSLRDYALAKELAAADQVTLSRC